MKEQRCFYSGEQFVPVCPITECPAFVPGSKTGCAYLEIKEDKTRLSKNDMSRLFNVSPATANKKYSIGKEEVRDMARLVIELTSNSIPEENIIKLEGAFFRKFSIPVNRNSLRIAARNREVRLILKRRMSKNQYTAVFRKGKPNVAHRKG